MTRHIGIYVGSERICAARVERNAVAASWDAPRTDASEVAPKLRACLDALARSRWAASRAQVTVALAPSYTQTKRLSGLPALPARELEQLVRLGARRFFMGDADRMTIAVAQRAADVLAECYDSAAIEACALVAREARLRLVVVSTASVLARMSKATPESFSVEERTLDIESKAGLLERAARRKASASSVVDPFAIAEAAACLPLAGVPAVVAHDASRAAIPRWRAYLAAGAAAAGLLAFAASPIASARLSAARSSRGLRELAATYREAAATERELSRVAALIGAIQMSATERNATTRLAAITMALPLDAALVALTADSGGASLVVVADEIMPVVAALDSASGIAAGTARILGPVTRERLGGVELERATIRLGWKDGVP